MARCRAAVRERPGSLFGSFYGPNITTHETGGIGAWARDEFAAALSDGVAPDGAHYFPAAFPYAHYAAYSDQDIADLWAAFRTVPPVAGRAPDHDLMFPFDRRTLAARWKALFHEPVTVTPDPAQSDAWNRGRWLAEGPGHCSACHTPCKPAQGAEIRTATRRWVRPGRGTHSVDHT